MGKNERYIRKLRVKGNNENSVARSITALEDAFNTASLPGLPPTGLILIRHLDLGVFSASNSSTTLSLLIDKSIRKLSGMAVCVDDQENRDAAVVWFSDTVQPYVTLASLIAREQTPTAWYWRCIIPQWQPAMNIQQALLVLIVGAMRTPANVFASARLLNHLREINRLDILLDYLTPQTAVKLLTETGIYPDNIKKTGSIPSAITSPLQYVSPAWQKVIVKWVERWGEQDVRSFWIVYNAILNHNPAIAESHFVLDTVHQLIIKIQYPDHPIAPDNEETILEGKAKSRSSKDYERNLKTEQNTNTFIETPESVEQIKKGLKEKRDNLDLVDNTLSQLSDKETQNDRNFFVSQFAGLVFIVPLLELLGIRDILNRHPELVECNLPGRILRAIARRFNILSDDPVCNFIPEIIERDNDRIAHFIAPSCWENLVFNPAKKGRSLCRCQAANAPQKWLITDKTRKLILAVGSPSQFKMLPPWLTECAIKTSADILPDTNSIESTIQLILGRYLRRYAGMGLRTLVRRKGCIWTTKTHLDVRLDLQHADVRIRRVGLDINPGWVSWLGKVVNFHYEHGEDNNCD